MLKVEIEHIAETGEKIYKVEHYYFLKKKLAVEKSDTMGVMQFTLLVFTVECSYYSQL